MVVDQTTRLPVAVDQTSRLPVAVDQTTRLPVAVDQTTRLAVVVDQTTRLPVAVDKTTRLPVAVDKTTLLPAAVDQTTRLPVAVDQIQQRRIMRSETDDTINRQLPLTHYRAVPHNSNCTVQMLSHKSGCRLLGSNQVPQNPRQPLCLCGYSGYK